MRQQAAECSFAPRLDATSAAMGVTSYGLAIPTLQEVFLKITAAADARDGGARRVRAACLGVPPRWGQLLR